MFTKLKLALMISAPLVAGSTAVALAHGSHDKAELLQKYDTNKDGKLDDSERAQMKADFQAKREAEKAAMLQKYDTNKDGKLDDTERAAMRSDKLTERFKQLDTNGDGVISLDEFKAQKPMGGHFRHGRRGNTGGHMRSRKLSQ